VRDEHSHLKIGAGLYSFSAVDGAARDRHVEHGSLPHIDLTSKHNGEVCVDSFAVPKSRHGSRPLLSQTIGRAKSSTVSFITREAPRSWDLAQERLEGLPHIFQQPAKCGKESRNKGSPHPNLPTKVGSHE